MSFHYKKLCGAIILIIIQIDLNTFHLIIQFPHALETNKLAWLYGVSYVIGDST